MGLGLRCAARDKVLSVWLYDREADKTIWKVDLPSDKASGAYEWYDLGECYATKT